ncbi:MAG: TlpA disulfide reductase family protein, partial [Sphingomonadales bacterium]
APAAPAAAAAAEPGAAAPINTIDRSHAGQPGPANVSWEMKGGAKQKLADHKGMKMLVNLWATWCAPCIAEMPALDKLALETDVMILPISQDMGGWKDVDPFWQKGKFKNIDTGLDQQSAFGEAIGARGLPVSILYDEEGKEIWRVSGVLKWDSAEVKAALKG